MPDLDFKILDQFYQRKKILLVLNRRELCFMTEANDFSNWSGVQKFYLAICAKVTSPTATQLFDSPDEPQFPVKPCSNMYY